ncbi:uncharacterized protein TNCV_3768601 [Trichonephila clavipes]|nr:uncharacterized protein TNCV_3768601 [Trichonephila clavipes]
MFETPLISQEPQNHHDDCYFCVVEINGINPRNGNKWSYPNSSSAQRPQLKSLEVQPSISKSSMIQIPVIPNKIHQVKILIQTTNLANNLNHLIRKN